jgi:catechol-2,3-dioxygenase
VLTLHAGTSTITFTDAAPHEPASYHFAFNIPPHLFADAKAWLADKVPLLHDQTGADAFHSDNWNADSVYFYDPAGNIVELIAHHALAGSETASWTSTSIVNVSEIGVVVDDVPATVQMIQERTGSTVYRGVVERLFTPVGDKHGLLIVVQGGREWFPHTRVPAQESPVRAVIESEAGTRYALVGPPYQIAAGVDV